MGKQTRTPSKAPRRQHRQSVKGARWHIDFSGGGNITRTKGGAKYCCALIDDATDMTWQYMSKHKSELPSILRRHFLKMKAQGISPAFARGDNEIRQSEECMKLFGELGIEVETTAPHNPHQNGVAERTFRTLFERVRAILHAANMPQSFWGEAVNYVLYTKARLPTRALEGKTPYEAWHGIKPDVSHLRPFGCVCYHHKEPKQQKLDIKSMKCRFLGYEAENQYRLWDIQNRKIIVSAHVRFDEQVSIGNDEEEEQFDDDDWAFIEVTVPSVSHTSLPDSREQISEEPAEIMDLVSEESSGIDDLSEVDESFHTDNDNDSIENDGANADLTPPASPRRLRDRGTRPDYKKLHGKRPYQNKKVHFIVRAAKIVPERPPVPKDVYEALTGPDRDRWEEAFDNELNNLNTQGVWDLKPVPKGERILPGRWVLVHKLGPIGEIVSYKARWVAKGFAQQHGLDYDLTYAAVVKSMSWRIILALVAMYNLEAEGFDIVSAFLEALLKKRIWVEQPHGYEKPGPNGEKLACLLKRALYGLSTVASRVV